MDAHMSLKKYLAQKNSQHDDDDDAQKINQKLKKKHVEDDNELDVVEKQMAAETRELKKKYGKKYDPKCHGPD